MSLQNIKTIIILMYENRSFDHMLGHLSYENILPEADGLKEPLTNYENLYQGGSYLPFVMPTDRELDFDIPHEYTDIALQLARSPVNGKLSMSGFVEAYAALPKLRQTYNVILWVFSVQNRFLLPVSLPNTSVFVTVGFPRCPAVPNLTVQWLFAGKAVFIKPRCKLYLQKITFSNGWTAPE
jgi:hypothetical protein